MITISRRRLRALRQVLRRPALGLPRRGPVPPLLLRAEPNAGLCVGYNGDAIALSATLPCRPRSHESLAVPLDALAEAEGLNDSLVIFDIIREGRVAVRWDSRGIPQAREYDVPAPGLAATDGRQLLIYPTGALPWADKRAIVWAWGDPRDELAASLASALDELQRQLIEGTPGKPGLRAKLEYAEARRAAWRRQVVLQAIRRNRSR